MPERQNIRCEMIQSEPSEINKKEVLHRHTQGNHCNADSNTTLDGGSSVMLCVWICYCDFVIKYRCACFMFPGPLHFVFACMCFILQGGYSYQSLWAEWLMGFDKRIMVVGIGHYSVYGWIWNTGFRLKQTLLLINSLAMWWAAVGRKALAADTAFTFFIHAQKA